MKRHVKDDFRCSLGFQTASAAQRSQWQWWCSPLLLLGGDLNESLYALSSRDNGWVGLPICHLSFSFSSFFIWLLYFLAASLFCTTLSIFLFFHTRCLPLYLCFLAHIHEHMGRPGHTGDHKHKHRARARPYLWLFSSASFPRLSCVHRCF